jgi:hypothetical protein
MSLTPFVSKMRANQKSVCHAQHGYLLLVGFVLVTQSYQIGNLKSVRYESHPPINSEVGKYLVHEGVHFGTALLFHRCYARHLSPVVTGTETTGRLTCCLIVVGGNKKQLTINLFFLPLLD